MQQIKDKVQVETDQDRRQAAHRRRRVIYNDDGGAVSGGGGTPDGYLGRRMAHVLSSHVDSVYYNTVRWADRFSHVTKVGEFVTESMVNDDPDDMRQLCLDFKRLADARKDGMQLTLEFCHQHDIEFIWSYRVNDIHDGFEIRRLAKIKRDNPDLMLGKREDKAKFPGGDSRHFWTAFNFAQEAVRRRRSDVIDDVLTRYDVDGIDLDFMRHPLFFASTMKGEPATRTELDLMTDLVRDVRARVQSASQSRDRPILLSVRTPVTLELCHHIGLELDKWLAEGLVDVLVLGGGYMPLTMDTKALIDLGHQFDVPVYPCLSNSGLRGAHRIPEGWRAGASNVFADGADGVMTFNYFPD